MKEKFDENRGFIKAMWCDSKTCEENIKSETGGATTRCICRGEEPFADTCIYCGKPTKHMVYFFYNLLESFLFHGQLVLDGDELNTKVLKTTGKALPIK